MHGAAFLISTGNISNRIYNTAMQTRKVKRRDLKYVKIEPHHHGCVLPCQQQRMEGAYILLSAYSGYLSRPPPGRTTSPPCDVSGSGRWRAPARCSRWPGRRWTTCWAACNPSGMSFLVGYGARSSPGCTTAPPLYRVVQRYKHSKEFIDWRRAEVP